MHKQTHPLSTFILSISLFCLLFSIYNLTYSGTYITDDEHILASRTLSVAFDPQLNDNRVLGNSRVFSYSSLTPIEATQGLNVEPVQAYLGSFLAKLALQLGFGRVQSIYLLNIILTALTAVIIFWIAYLSGYSKLTSYMLGVLFGICTVAWPYTRTYFRDSVAMFFLTMSWGAYQLIISTRLNNLRIKYLRSTCWVFLVLSLWLGILSKNSIVFAIPVIAVSILYEAIKHKTAFNRKLRTKSNLVKGFIVFASLLVFFLLWLKLLPATGVFSRFTYSYYQTVLLNFINNPHPQLIQALLGPIISPGKSIFLYSPILLLALFSLIKFFRQAWPAWLYFLLLVIGQGLFYGADWWGHVNWGLRFLLPAIPLLVIASAPVVELLLETKKGQQKLLYLGSLSVFIQLTGILAPVKQYYIALTESAPSISYTSAIWNPKNTALWWHLKWIFSGGLSDLATSRVGIWSLPLAAFLLIVLICSIALVNRRSKPWHAIIILIVTIISSGIMLSVFRFDPANKPRNDLVEAQNAIQDFYLQDDIILIKSYGTQAWSYWMNWADPGLKWISLPYFYPNQYSTERYIISKDPSDSPNSISQRIIQKAEDEYERVWLVLPDDSPGSNFNWETTYLAQNGQMVNYWVFSESGFTTHLYLFDSVRN